jgi:hypothetical protein
MMGFGFYILQSIRMREKRMTAIKTTREIYTHNKNMQINYAIVI